MSEEFRLAFLPYCLDRQPDGRYAVLNRRYKPVGMVGNAHVTYADHPCLVRLKGLRAATAAKLSHNGDESVDRIYLYADAQVPTSSTQAWQAYADRLQRLAAMKVGD